MKLLFKQRFFSWFDSYDIYDEAGNTVYTVKGELAWGHLLRIYDSRGNAVGCVKERIFTWLPKFEMYLGDNYIAVVYESFYHTTLEQMLGNDLSDVLFLHTAVEGAVGVKNNHRTQSAETEATGLNDLDFLCKTLLFDLTDERVLDLQAAGRGTTGTAAA